MAQTGASKPLRGDLLRLMPQLKRKKCEDQASSAASGIRVDPLSLAPDRKQRKTRSTVLAPVRAEPTAV